MTGGKKINKMPDLDVLHDLLSYDEKTGLLTWRKRSVGWFSHCANPQREASRWNTRYAGKQAGTSSSTHGYVEQLC